MNLIGFLCLVSSTNAFLTQNERHRIIGPVPAIDSRRQTVSLYPKDDQRILTLTYHHTQLSVRGGGSDDDVSSSIEKAKAFVSKNFFLLGMAAAVSFAKLFPQVREDTLKCIIIKLAMILIELYVI